MLGIEHVRSLVGRGVLLDMPGLFGVDRIADGHEITAAELDEAAEWAGVEIRSGDIVLIRTGRMQLWLNDGDAQGQNWNLETLAEVCREQGRHEFFLSATPEPFVGGTGAPVAPVAVF